MLCPQLTFLHYFLQSNTSYHLSSLYPVLQSSDIYAIYFEYDDIFANYTNLPKLYHYPICFQGNIWPNPTLKHLNRRHFFTVWKMTAYKSLLCLFLVFATVSARKTRPSGSDTATTTTTEATVIVFVSFFWILFKMIFLEWIGWIRWIWTNHCSFDCHFKCWNWIKLWFRCCWILWRICYWWFQICHCIWSPQPQCWIRSRTC